MSAVSTDLLHWKVERGVRVGPGATLKASAEHPSATVNARPPGTPGRRCAVKCGGTPGSVASR